MAVDIEHKQMFQLAFALILIAQFSWLYARGGRNNKWIRRYLGASIFALGCNGLAFWSGCWHWLMLVPWLTLPAALTVGYDADDFVGKASRRLLYGFLVGASVAPFFIPLGLIGAMLFQVALATSVSFFYGVFNPTSAVAEEGLIGAGLVLSVPFILVR